jgi:sugar diacid utilization regulator
MPRTSLRQTAVQMEDILSRCLWTVREGRLVVLVAIGARTHVGWDCYVRAERILGQCEELVSLLAERGMRAYVAEPFERLALVPDRFRQAADLRHANVGGGDTIVYLWHHRLAVLVSLAPMVGQVNMILDKRVVTMRHYDTVHGTSYFQTACETVEHPNSPTEAARALNVHRNTYFYRIHKISELFFLDLRRGDDRLAVAVCMRFLKEVGDRIPLPEV